MNPATLNVDSVREELERISELPLAQKPLNGFISGDYETYKKGEGLDPYDLRPYEVGDDYRHINWTATARSGNGEYIIQTHFAEDTPSFYVASDVASSRYRNDAPRS